MPKALVQGRTVLVNRGEMTGLGALAACGARVGVNRGLFAADEAGNQREVEPEVDELAKTKALIAG